MTRSTLHSSLLLLALAAAPASAAEPAALTAAIRGLQSGVLHGKASEVRQARASFAALAADEPGAAALQYWIALADWRVVPLITKDEPEEAKKLCKEGIAACDRALQSDPKFADALALRAGLQGISLGFLPAAAAMTLGPEMEEEYGRAGGMAPGNPRVELLAGINTLHKPAFVGGGPEKANARFDKAIALFAAAPKADSTAIAWGEEDAWLWSGRCRGQLGDWAGARERFRKVLVLAPGHAWTEYVLLPEAERQLAAKPDSTREKK